MIFFAYAKSDICALRKLWSIYIRVWVSHPIVIPSDSVGIKPKAVLKVFDQYGLTGQQIGSHLQKYKMRLVCDYRLGGYEQIENWMIPLQFSQDEELQQIARKWRVEAGSPERATSATAVSAE